MAPMNVLVIAPHPDDESIGCGGALCKHTAQGDRVAAVFLTSGELGLKHLPREQAWKIREQEAGAAARLIGIADLIFLRGPDWSIGSETKKMAALLRPVLKQENPQLIYLPHPREWHPDHQAALPILRAALKSSGLPAPTLRTYEVWTPLSEYDQVEDITAVMARKTRAIRAHRSQLNEWDYLRAVRGLNEYRGALAARCRYAEVFQDLNSSSR
jgi:N-acetylglucosamine malate deacetylase 1